MIAESTVRPARGPGAILAASECSTASRTNELPVSAAIGQLKQNLHGRGAAIMDAPAVVALVCVEDPENGQPFNGDVSHSQLVLVDASWGQCRVGWSQAAAHIGCQARIGIRIPAEVHIVLDAGHLPTEKLEAVMDRTDVASERVTRCAVVVDVDLPTGHVEVLVLQLGQLDLCCHLAVFVPVVTDAGDARLGHDAIVLEPQSCLGVVPVNVPDAVRERRRPVGGRES